MGRGTPEVLTGWTPFGDIPVGGGGLMILEDSHRPVRRPPLADYLHQDVDSYCLNGPNADAVRDGTMRWSTGIARPPGATGAARSPPTPWRSARRGEGAG